MQVVDFEHSVKVKRLRADARWMIARLDEFLATEGWEDNPKAVRCFAKLVATGGPLVGLLHRLGADDMELATTVTQAWHLSRALLACTPTEGSA